jgi:hypothetical protein
MEWWGDMSLFNKLKGANMQTDVTEIQINGVAYVPKGSQAVQFTGDTKIVVLQRGWVMVGRFERNGSDCKLHNASVIRSWGTTKGLGEIASEGPKSSTKLDKCNGLVEFDYLTVVASIACNESAWKAHV